MQFELYKEKNLYDNRDLPELPLLDKGYLASCFWWLTRLASVFPAARGAPGGQGLCVFITTV